MRNDDYVEVARAFRQANRLSSVIAFGITIGFIVVLIFMVTL